MSSAEIAMVKYRNAVNAGKKPQFDRRYKPIEMGLKAGKVVQLIPVLSDNGERTGFYKTMPIFA